MFMYPIKNESQQGLLLLAFISVLWVYPTSCYEVTELSGCSVLDGPLSPFQPIKKKVEILKTDDCYKEEIQQLNNLCLYTMGWSSLHFINSVAVLNKVTTVTMTVTKGNSYCNN